MSKFIIRRWPSLIHRLLGLGPLMNVVAVHSMRTCLPANIIESWYNEAIVWMENLGSRPRTLSFVGVEGFKDGESYDFDKADRKIRGRGFAGISSVMIEASPLQKIYIAGLTDQWKLHISASLRSMLQECGESCLVWAWEQEKKPFSREEFLNAVDFAKRWRLIDYAFFFQDFSRSFPATEAARSAFSEKLIRKHGMLSSTGYPTKKVYETGKHPIDFLREIYPYQILSPVHLSYQVGSQTLREWIDSSEAHGTLEKFTEQRWLWTIPKTQLAAVRATLAKNNLLTLYLPDMSRILEDYGRPQCT